MKTIVQCHESTEVLVMEENVCVRFLVRRLVAPIALASLAQDELIRILDNVSLAYYEFISIYDRKNKFEGFNKYNQYFIIHNFLGQ